MTISRGWMDICHTVGLFFWRENATIQEFLITNSFLLTEGRCASILDLGKEYVLSVDKWTDKMWFIQLLGSRVSN